MWALALLQTRQKCALALRLGHCSTWRAPEHIAGHTPYPCCCCCPARRPALGLSLPLLASCPSVSFLVKHGLSQSLLVQVDGILKTVLRDEIIAWHKKTQEDTSSPLSAAGQPENMDSQQLVSLVQKAVTAIMTRLHNLAQFEGGESKVNTLVAAANSLDNLCRMDPAWHPWL